METQTRDDEHKAAAAPQDTSKKTDSDKNTASAAVSLDFQDSPPDEKKSLFEGMKEGFSKTFGGGDKQGSEPAPKKGTQQPDGKLNSTQQAIVEIVTPLGVEAFAAAESWIWSQIDKDVADLMSADQATIHMIMEPSVRILARRVKLAGINPDLADALASLTALAHHVRAQMKQYREIKRDLEDEDADASQPMTRASRSRPVVESQPEQFEEDDEPQQYRPPRRAAAQAQGFNAREAAQREALAALSQRPMATKGLYGRRAM